MTNINAIVAVCDNWGIGYRGNLLVHNRADMRRFTALTVGKIVVMGHNTMLSLPQRRPLKNRRNIVLTHSASLPYRGFEVAHSYDEVLSMIGSRETWIIGGASVYRLFLPDCQRIEVTKHHCIVPADTFFPVNLDLDEAWQACPASDVTGGLTEDGLSYDFLAYLPVY